MKETRCIPEEKNYDLSLPCWGPYNKKYAGFSHIADEDEGITLDIDIFPGYFRRKVFIPGSVSDEGAKAFMASPDFSHIAYRYELEWKDKTYCDVHMYQKDGNCCFVCDFVNNTEENQSLQLDMVMSPGFPTHYHQPLEKYVVNKNEDTVWINAVDYSDISVGDYFPIDARRKGEGIFRNFTKNNGISGSYFNRKGYYVKYNPDDIEADSIGIRYTAKEDAVLRISINGHARDINIEKSEKPKFFAYAIDRTAVSELIFEIVDNPVSIDGIAVGMNVFDTTFTKTDRDCAPEVRKNGNETVIKYPNLKNEYRIVADCENFVVRSFVGENIGNMLTSVIHNHVTTEFDFGPGSHFCDIFVRPIMLRAHEHKEITFNIYTNDSKEAIKREPAFSFAPNEAGKKYLQSQNIMSAVTLMNVVYPIYCRGKYIKHNTPGRFWDSLYTWDSGFIGMGLSSISTKRGEECLNTYLTKENDFHSPFILHGTPLATQALLYAEIYNKTGDIEFAKKYYPSMMQYLEYFYSLRKDPKQPKTGLINTWHLFYSSGGWDDYPTQERVHDLEAEESVSPVITSSFTVLFAKIMRNFSAILGKKEDYAHLSDIISEFEESLEYAWDEESGYYGYVVHDKNGRKTDILRTDDGLNYDMGADGIYPYISMSCPEERNAVLLDDIKRDLLTEYGISVVSKNAPYFSDCGYWNGSVWMPHQWIIWKALLDHGEMDFAFKVADIALNLWKHEIDLTYNCYEHFMLSNGRGAGFHQFSGLSTPVLLWYNSYYVPGHVTAGFSALISDIHWEKDNAGVSFNVISDQNKVYALVCLNDSFEYKAENAKIIREAVRGTYEIEITVNGEPVRLYK